nr:hypothetical protein [Tanacetum cinerariifolium]
AISSEKTPSKKNPIKAKKEVPPSKKKPASKPKPTMIKAPVKVYRGKDEGTGAKPRVSDVPKYDSRCDKGYWGDSREEDDDDEDDIKDEKGNDDDDDDNGDNDDDGSVGVCSCHK